MNGGGSAATAASGEQQGLKSDLGLRPEVDGELSLDPQLAAGNSTVIVSNGVITLTGQGVRGYLDGIDLGQATEFERRLLSQIRSWQQEILQAIRTDREIKPEIETLLVSFLDSFVETFV